MRKFLFFFMLLFFSAEGGAAPSSAFSSDFYKILGVLPGASSETLEKAGQRVRESLGSSPSLESKKRLEEAERALEILQDPRLRAGYDSWLKEAGFKEETNFYRLFGVPSDSPPAKITRAYRQILPNIHPDKKPGDPDETNRRTQELLSAHKALSDPLVRLRHDRALRVFEGNLLESFETRGAAPQPPNALAMMPSASPRSAGAAAAASQPPDAQAAEEGGASRFHKIMADLKEEESSDALLFNEEVFALAKDLEAAGGAANIQEAVFWYRSLAAEGHVEAAKRLAPLLDSIGDVEEALYRYRQGSMDDSDREFSRAAFFREAQMRLKGVYDESGSAVISKDPARALELFERAFELGASQEAVAEEYELIRDYEKAMEWRLREKGGRQIGGAKTEGGGRLFAEDGALFAEDGALFAEPSDSPIHQAIMTPEYGRIGYGYPNIAEQQESILRMLKLFEKNGETDWNAYSGGRKRRTPLSLAAGRRMGRVVEFLISRGADQTIRDMDGNFPGLLPIHQALLSKEFRIDLFPTLHLLEQTWTARAGTGSHGKTPLEMALEQYQEHYQGTGFDMGHAFFAEAAVRKKGVSYLSDKEFNRIVGKAAMLGHELEQTVSLLMNERKKLSEAAAADKEPDKKPASVEAKPNSSNWLSRWLGRKKCRAAVLPG